MPLTDVKCSVGRASVTEKLDNLASRRQSLA